MAGRFPRLTPDAQKRMQERMGEYARLSPEQRMTARENFRQATNCPDQRQEKLQRYQALPEEKKRALTEQAAKKAAERLRYRPLPFPPRPRNNGPMDSSRDRRV